ncbi:arylsulfatase A-like [Antedon mediterranea]|uniref:arylsulfatase A-like n=1 Tax=Antedon mediterranea TaxID=105859 RepID=UPI003AF9D80F
MGFELFKSGRSLNVTNLIKLVIFLLVIKVDLYLCKSPNIVIFLADDVGYGDLQSFGNPLASTPNIDALVREGKRFTQFYSASPVCSPARAALLTGRYPVRTGVWNDIDPAVFVQESIYGLRHEEITIPEMLASNGYKSGLVGKWHLGVGKKKEFLPLNHGFDFFFGLPNTLSDCPNFKCYYPDDECEGVNYSPDKAPCTLVFNNDIIEQPIDLVTLAERQIRAAKSFIQTNACDGTPFFLLYSSLHTHTPQFAGRRYRNTTLGGPYTDSLAELDGEVGDIIQELRDSGVLENTLVIFTSDNGPDRRAGTFGGFNGIFRCGKSTTFEGGIRVPTVIYWQGRISPGISTELLSHLDIWPTIRRITGSSTDDIVLDGVDFSDVLFRDGESPVQSLLIFDITPSPVEGPFALRTSQYKAHYFTECTDRCEAEAIDYMCSTNATFQSYEPPIIYDILLDPEERDDISNTSYSLVDELAELLTMETAKISFSLSALKDLDWKSQLCCNTGCTPYPQCCNCPSNYTNTILPLYDDCKLQPVNNRHFYRKENCKDSEKS